jgi:microsomal dipeptidase-like Zn-dependent dipeptidase
VFDTAELEEYVRAHPELFPAAEGYSDGAKMVAPEQLREIAGGLFARGYESTDVRNIIGGNFARIARATWPR